MMSKKKEEQPVKEVLMGRVGTNLSIGIVGLPNVGKSTFFNVLTRSEARAENFPFCTVKPNESRVAVPDERFDWLVAHHQPERHFPAFLSVMDIAGLVKGAHEGEGLGNEFLSNIRSVDAIFHVVRAFESTDITHVEGDVDPIRDLQIIVDELLLKDEDNLRKDFDKLEKQYVRGGDKKLAVEYDVVRKVLNLVAEEKRMVRTCAFNPTEVEVINTKFYLSCKPIIYLVNLSEKDFLRKKNKWLPKIAEWVKQNDPGALIIPFSAEFELNLFESGGNNIAAGAADGEAAAAASNDDATASPVAAAGGGAYGHHAQSILPKIITQGYKALNLIYFFTCGKDEVKAWTIQVGDKAPQAAGKIHTDMERGFIMAEVMSYEDFRAEGSEAAVKAKGKYKNKGRDYVVEDGDIIFFKFNAGAGLTAAKKK